MNSNLDCAAKRSCRRLSAERAVQTDYSSPCCPGASSAEGQQCFHRPPPPAPLLQPGPTVFSFPQAAKMFCCIADGFKR